MDSTYTKDMPLAAPGLAIHGASSPVPKISNTVAYRIANAIYPAVTAADLPALTTAYNLANSQQIILTVCLSAAGVYTYVASSILSATAALLKDVNGNVIRSVGTLAPATHTFGTCLIGWIIISADSSHTFTGGTTNLDAAGITVTYIDNFGLTGK